MPKLQRDWHSPTRLLSDPTAQYDFPGDRFIPNRSLMDLNQAHSLLTSRTKKSYNSDFSERLAILLIAEVYRQKLEKKLTLDSVGIPFRMSVFRGSPKSSRRSIRLIDELRREEAAAWDSSTKHNQFRHLQKSPDGLTVASAGADETLRFWEVFGPASTDHSTISELDGLLSRRRHP